MRLLPVAALIFLVSCAPPVLTPEEKAAKCGPRPTQQEAEAAVKTWCDGHLKDPFSAQTRGILVLGPGAYQIGLVSGGGWRYGWLVSFQVNAKNSYGGYTGWTFREWLWQNGQIIDLVGAPPVLLK